MEHTAIEEFFSYRVGKRFGLILKLLVVRTSGMRGYFWQNLYKTTIEYIKRTAYSITVYTGMRKIMPAYTGMINEIS